MNKNNSVISNDDINIIKDYIEEVQKNTKTMTSVNDLNIVIKEFESSYSKIEKEKIKGELQKFKNFWHKLMTRFHNKISFDKDEQYKYVSEDLHKADVFSDDDFEIATNALRKVKPKEEIQEKEQKKNDSDRWKIRK